MSLCNIVWQALSTGDPVVGGVVYDNEYVSDIVQSCIISLNTNNISMIISMHFSGCPSLCGHDGMRCKNCKEEIWSAGWVGY